MARKVNYFEAQRPYSQRVFTVLVNTPAAVVPVAISALETRKRLSFWEDVVSWENAYQDITRMQWELLMDAKNDLIQEIRGIRGSYETTDTTVETWPVGTYPGFQLININNTLYNTDGYGVGQLLGQIRDILAQQGTQDEGQLEALLQIVALLSV